MTLDNLTDPAEGTADGDLRNPAAERNRTPQLARASGLRLVLRLF